MCPRGDICRIFSNNFRTFELLPHTVFAQRKCEQCLTKHHRSRQWLLELMKICPCQNKMQNFKNCTKNKPKLIQPC